MSSRQLCAATLFFLGLPYALFFAGWLQPLWAVAAILLLLIACGSALQAWPQADRAAASRLPLSPVHWVLLLGLAVGLAYLSGAGGYGFQTHDWIKHEALLADLIARPWPVAYTYYTQPVALVYYFAQYLPAAAVGKLAGPAAAHAFLLGWTSLGLLLVLGWFCLLVRRATAAVLAVLLFFGGLDWLGLLLRHAWGWLVIEAEDWREIEDWSDLVLQFDAPANSLFWAPQHALAGWLAGAMLAYLLLHARPRLYLVPVALTPLWSPLITLGLLPLLVVRGLTDHLPWRQRLAALFSLPNLTSLGLLALMGFYLSAKLGQISPLLVGSLPHGWLPVSVEMGWAQRLGEIGLFLLLEVGLWALLLVWGRSHAHSREDVRGLGGSVLLGLFGVSLYGVGLNNDLGMRASIPLIFLLAAMVARTLTDPTVSRHRRGALLGLLILAAATPATAYVRQIAPLISPAAPWQSADHAPNSGIQTLYEQDAVRFSQYVGSTAAPFFQTLARPLALPPVVAGPEYVSYGDKLLLASVQAHPPQPAPGATVELLLELHVFTQVIDQNYGLQLRLVDDAGRVIWQEQGWPQNRPTREPSEDLIWFDTRTLSLPPDLAPGLYRLDLGVVAENRADADGGDLLPAHRLPGGMALGELPPVGYLEVGDVRRTEVTPISPAPQWGDALVLEGARLAPAAPLTMGTPLTMTLRWAATARPPDGLTGFVHVLDAQGTLVAQWDQPLLGGFLPTGLWQPGLRVDDHYPLTLPADLPAGKYTWLVGLYDASSGQRLPVRVEDATRANAWAVSTFQVVR